MSFESVLPSRTRLPLKALALITSGAAMLLAPAEPASANRGGDIAATLGPRLVEARSHAKTAGESLWPGYSRPPFSVLLIGASGETLLCHPNLPDGFAAEPIDRSTGCASYVRPRSGLPDSLLSAMPVFGLPSTIVMGTPEATGRTDAAWRLTLLHERFHQWQSALPGYYERVADLGLAGGDTTGMWMLNFAFPYQDQDVGRLHAAASLALAAALDARRTVPFLPALDRYIQARRAFERAVGTANWRYLEFQLWQEGVARWTEITLGRTHPTGSVRERARVLEEQTIEALRRPNLAVFGREAAYSFGAGEAMLLETCGEVWRHSYPQVLELGSLLVAARQRCR